MRPICFVFMPYGKKETTGYGIIDFDGVYTEIIAPAITDSGLKPLRADKEMVDGIITTPMIERLILCDYAIADLTTGNANLFYTLGIRHALRGLSTVLLFAKGINKLPFLLNSHKALSYGLSPDGSPAKNDTVKEVLKKNLIEAKKAHTDSSLYQMVNNYPDIAHTKTDLFRDRVNYCTEIKKRLQTARKKGIGELKKIELELRVLNEVEGGVIIDLLLSYRSVSAWAEMILLTDKMPSSLAASVMVQEQLALALNRNGQSEKAEYILLALLKNRGPSSETYAILGRVYKDRWEKSYNAGKKSEANSLLKKAINTYLKGFEADWRDAYPGINAVTLMELSDPVDPKQKQLIPVVTYAVNKKIASKEPDYWDHATLLELAVLARDKGKAMDELNNAQSLIREKWEPETTIRTLRLIREAREKRKDNVSWIKRIEEKLFRG